MLANHKKILCRCEDIQEKDILNCIQNGYTDLESIKRYTGIGTGPCQSRFCLTELLKLLKKNNISLDKGSSLLKIRPPMTPIEMKRFTK